MAHALIPSAAWQEILDIKDETKQGIAATEYVCSLEEEIIRLKNANEELSMDAEYKTIDYLMQTKPFRNWLAKQKTNEDWNGLQEGF